MNLQTGRFIEINGGRRLSGGRVSIAGSSNQVTKCIIASLLTDDPVLIKDAPQVDESRSVQELYVSLGGEVRALDEHTLALSSKNVFHAQPPADLCRKNRIAILTAGPLLHRFGRVSLLASLGGDRIGQRPVNFHIHGLQQMGAKVELHQDRYEFIVPEKGLTGAHIVLPYPSVMATENLIMTATLCSGRTIIENAAIEPEVIELCKMLQKMGADIMFNANRTYVIQGVKKLKGCELRCMPDRNQAVSFAVAALATGGDVLLEKLPHEPIYSFLNFIQRMGAEFRVDSKGVFVSAPQGKKLQATHIEVDVHPGFMTDWQQPFLVLFTQAEGVSILHETVFEDRLGYSQYLRQMGANINLFSTCLGELPCRFRNGNHIHSAIVQGPTPLHGGNFALPKDIRAGMCLVIAGLVAQGQTRLSNIHELERKYDNLVPKLQELGADINIC